MEETPGLYTLLRHTALDSYRVNKELPPRPTTPVRKEQQCQVGTEDSAMT
jgi:hypothetical protein